MNKKGFIMWGDFFRGFFFAFILTAVIFVLIANGFVPFPLDVCNIFG